MRVVGLGDARQLRVVILYSDLKRHRPSKLLYTQRTFVYWRPATWAANLKTLKTIVRVTLETAEVRDDLPLGKRKADCDHLENLVKSLEAGRVY